MRDAAVTGSSLTACWRAERSRCSEIPIRILRNTSPPLIVPSTTGEGLKPSRSAAPPAWDGPGDPSGDSHRCFCERDTISSPSPLALRPCSTPRLTSRLPSLLRGGARRCLPASATFPLPEPTVSPSVLPPSYLLRCETSPAWCMDMPPSETASSAATVACTEAAGCTWAGKYKSVRTADLHFSFCHERHTPVP